MRLFKRKKKAKKDLFEVGNFNLKDVDPLSYKDFMVSFMYSNYMVDTIYPACASCYGISLEKNKSEEERLAYIRRRVASGHTSILEHSNVIVQAFIPLYDKDINLYELITDNNKYIKAELSDINTSDQDIITMISEVRDTCRYLAIETDVIFDNMNLPILRMTIGGSIRGFRYIFENIRNRTNALFISIFNVLKLAVPREFFIDYINDGLMGNYETIYIHEDLNDNLPQRLLNNTEDDKIDIINMDSLSHISNILKLDKEKCFDFVSITTDFKNMSRIITQQLTRHRNGITQESQRYVNYSDSVFNSPSKFKDKYDETIVYHTPIGDYNLESLGNLLTSIYNSLVEQKVDKEDARGYLPQNVQCGKLFMTFNLRTLFAFLNLRLDPHAQAEIRQYAERLVSLTSVYAKELDVNLSENSIENMKEAAKVYSRPIYNRFENIEIDEEV